MKYSPYELLFEVIPKGIDFSKLIGQPLGEEQFTLLNYKRDFAQQNLVKKQVKEWNPSFKFKKEDIVLVK